MSDHQVTPNSDYRPNPKHAVEVFGTLTEELGERLAIRINELRSSPDGDKPITVFINSRGGLVRVLEIIHGALSTRDQDNRSVRIITVSIGESASAAANLLAFGDYAIAYSHSVIYFHGVRANEVELTAEDAAGVAKRFAAINRKTANELARRVMGRMAYRYITAKSDVKRRLRRCRAKKQQKSELECFGEYIKDRVGAKARQLVEESISNVQFMYSMIGNVFSKIDSFGNASQVRRDFKVLRALVEHELKFYRKHNLVLNEAGINELASDYLVLRDGVFGEHVTLIRRAVRTWGAAFLSEPDFQLYRSKKEANKEEAATAILLKKAGPVAEPFFYFVIHLCRNLLKGENRLSPVDAYWLGIVDEVAGTSLTGERLLAERTKAPPPAVAPPAESLPSSSAPIPPSPSGHQHQSISL
jgi:Protease subunit of ATP-dependent Clp proteases